MKYDGKEVWCVWVSRYRYETHTEYVIQKLKRFLHVFEDEELPIVFSSKNNDDKSLEKCKSYVLKKLKKEIPKDELSEYSFIEKEYESFGRRSLDIRFRHKSHIEDNESVPLTPIF